MNTTRTGLLYIYPATNVLYIYRKCIMLTLDQQYRPTALSCPLSITVKSHFFLHQCQWLLNFFLVNDTEDGHSSARAGFRQQRMCPSGRIEGRIE